jgi:hypothetical protein
MSTQAGNFLSGDDVGAIRLGEVSLQDIDFDVDSIVVSRALRPLVTSLISRSVFHQQSECAVTPTKEGFNDIAFHRYVR